MVSIITSLPTYLLIVQGVLLSAIGVCMLVPGDEPEKSLTKLVNFISKFSKKPPTE